MRESTDEGSQLWKSEVEVEEEEKYSYVWRRRTSDTTGTMEGIRSELLCQKEALTTFHLCFLRFQAQISTGNILRLSYQIRFSFPSGILKFPGDFKKRQEDPASFLISGF